MAGLSDLASVDGESLPFVHPCPTSTRADRTSGLRWPPHGRVPS